MPGPKIRYTTDDLAEVPILWTGDVAVIGGGSAGSSAATASARLGAKTILVESGAFLGGTGARVLDTFYGFYAPGEAGLRTVGGIGQEICEQLTARDMAFERPNTYGGGTGVTYEPEALKSVWDEITTTAGVSTLFYGLATGVIMDGTLLVGVVLETKSGPVQIRANALVDATGDAEIAWRAGATTDNGNGTVRPQPATATFRVGGVTEPAASTQELHALIREASKSGDYTLPRLEGSIHITNLPGIRHANLTRMSGMDLTDPWQLSNVEVAGRQQSMEYVRFLQDRVPGYRHSYLVATSTRVGVRETRRLVGEYVLDREDFVHALSHDDDIARCGAPIEDHGQGDSTRWEYVGGLAAPDGRSYGVPFGSLVPLEVENLLVAGRCLSATHEAHASVRSIAQCMAMGQAAGAAAALASDAGVLTRDIDRRRLRSVLSDAGAIL